ncbi:MAG TPA: hypothetical protein VK580_15770 [Steroidobacteraceae bacterium]|nr:hypothetical protein [Steroidobacteraceae bacterium]
MRESKSTTTLAGIVVLGSVFGGTAQAGCLDAKAVAAPFASHLADRSGGQFIAAVYHPGSDSAGFVQISTMFEESPAIVGTWEWEWRAKDDLQFPDGTLIDFGTIQWHEDGTEITISGGRTPAVGDVCMGSWRQVGHSRFRLTHVAMGYGPPQGPATGYSGLAVLDMTVTVDPSGDRYHGNFTLTQYHLKFDPNVPNSEFDTSEVDYQFGGPVTGIRVSPK